MKEDKIYEEFRILMKNRENKIDSDPSITSKKECAIKYYDYRELLKIIKKTPFKVKADIYDGYFSSPKYYPYIFNYLNDEGTDYRQFGSSYRNKWVNSHLFSVLRHRFSEESWKKPPTKWKCAPGDR